MFSDILNNEAFEFGVSFGNIDVTFSLQKSPSALKSSVIAMVGYKIYCCYPALSKCGIALVQVMLSSKLHAFFQKIFWR